MKYMICETVKNYHEIDINDEIDIKDIIEESNDNLKSFENACEIIETFLKFYKDKYGFNYVIKPYNCGTEIENIELIQEIY